MNKCKQIFRKLLKCIPAAFIAFMFIALEFPHKRYVENLKSCPNITNRTCPQCLPQGTHHIVSGKKTLCLTLIGRLGNNLFQIASVFGIARAKDMQLSLKNNSQLKSFNEIFNIKSLPVKISCPEPHIMDVKDCSFSNVIFKYPNNRDYSLLGYFQSWLYFISVEPEIRAMFTFQSKIREKAHNILRNITQFHRKIYSLTKYPLMKYVGIHVRRGDFVKESNIKFGYKTAPALYFKNAMDYYRKQFKDMIFIVCSDNIEWSISNLGHNSTYYVHEAYYVDLAVLSLCNHSIVSVGSFGWWSAWLANGQTVYYPHSVKKNTLLNTKFSNHKHDYFPFKWIPIDI